MPAKRGDRLRGQVRALYHRASPWAATSGGAFRSTVKASSQGRPLFDPNGKQIAFTTIAAGTAWEIWVVNLDGSSPHKVVGTVGTDPNNSTYIAAWKKGQFLIGGYQGRWDPYFVTQAGGEPVRVAASEKDDKPTDWWLP
jgi:Tol biopolymer transport system component